MPVMFEEEYVRKYVYIYNRDFLSLKFQRSHSVQDLRKSLLWSLTWVNNQSMAVMTLVLGPSLPPSPTSSMYLNLTLGSVPR